MVALQGYNFGYGFGPTFMRPRRNFRQWPRALLLSFLFRKVCIAIVVSGSLIPNLSNRMRAALYQSGSKFASTLVPKIISRSTDPAFSIILPVWCPVRLALGTGALLSCKQIGAQLKHPIISRLNKHVSSVINPCFTFPGAFISELIAVATTSASCHFPRQSVDA